MIVRHCRADSGQQTVYSFLLSSLSLYAGKVDELLSDSSKKHEIKFIVLDFTLVLAIDSSAAETIGVYVTLQ
jgi:hypothetical protein